MLITLTIRVTLKTPQARLFLIASQAISSFLYQQTLSEQAHHGLWQRETTHLPSRFSRSDPMEHSRLGRFWAVIMQPLHQEIQPHRWLSRSSTAIWSHRIHKQSKCFTLASTRSSQRACARNQKEDSSSGRKRLRSTLWRNGTYLKPKSNTFLGWPVVKVLTLKMSHQA